MTPGETLFADGDIELNPGRPPSSITITNTSGHTIFISSHYPLFEVNRRLVFDRAAAWGMRLAIPAGDAVRWLPDETKIVDIVPFSGAQIIAGFNHLTDGPASPVRRAGGLRRLLDAGYAHTPVGEGA